MTSSVVQTTEEKWRTIPEFPNYVISNHGRVANKVSGEIKAIVRNKMVRLSRNGWIANRSISTLMKVWQNPRIKITSVRHEEDFDAGRIDDLCFLGSGHFVFPELGR